MQIMLTIPTDNYYNAPQTWDAQYPLPDGYAIVPETIDLAGFYALNGFVSLTVAEIDGVPTVTGYEPNITAWDAHITWTLDEVRYACRAKMSAHCEETIRAGVDVELSDGTTGHFALTENDQINLSGAVAAVQQGAAAYPYHADGQLCRPYPAADILAIGAAATAHKLYHTTYCNHLFAWIARADIDELQGIRYGAQLPDDLAESMARAMDAARS